MTEVYFKIGDVAEQLNTTIRTIRYYEEEGLLNPHRTNGGTRLYSQYHVERLKAIVHLVENNFSLDIVRLIETARTTSSTGNEGSQKVSNILEQLDNEIEKQITALNTLKSDIKSAQRQVRKCKDCRNHPSSGGCPTCPINKQLGHSEILNLIWE